MEEVFNVLNDLSGESLKLIKASEKYTLNISIQVIKRIKDLKIPLNEKKISDDEILEDLLKKKNSDEKKILDLQKEINEMKEKLEAEKIEWDDDDDEEEEYYDEEEEEENDDDDEEIEGEDFRINNIWNAKKIDQYNADIHSLIALKDWRFSIGHFKKPSKSDFKFELSEEGKKFFEEKKKESQNIEKMVYLFMMVKLIKK